MNSTPFEYFFRFFKLFYASLDEASGEKVFFISKFTGPLLPYGLSFWNVKFEGKFIFYYWENILLLAFETSCFLSESIFLRLACPFNIFWVARSFGQTRILGTGSSASCNLDSNLSSRYWSLKSEFEKAEISSSFLMDLWRESEPTCNSMRFFFCSRVLKSALLMPSFIFCFLGVTLVEAGNPIFWAYFSMLLFIRKESSFGDSLLRLSKRFSCFIFGIAGPRLGEIWSL